MSFVPGSHGEPAWLSATRIGDRLYAAFCAVRDEIALAFVSARTWSDVTRQGCARQARFYRAPAYRATRLFDWERQALEEFFPRPPARLLVGAAGAGREMIALAEQGYEVAGFEPAPALFDALGDHLAEAGRSAAIALASYEDLVAALDGRGPGEAPESLRALCEGQRYDGAVLGFGSLSYVVEAHTRADLLRVVARLCVGGPVLLSFEQHEEASGRLARWRRRLRGLLARLPGSRPLTSGDRLGDLGFEHAFTPAEIEELARPCGYRVARFASDSYPHAVLTRDASVS